MDQASETTTEDQIRVLINIFFSISHIAFIRQSIHQPSFEGADLSAHSRFLLFAICSLAALHISESDVVDTFNGEIAMQVSQRLATIAQRYSRDTSDKPSGYYIVTVPTSYY